MANAADMMMSRDAAGRAWNARVAAEAKANEEWTMESAQEAARATKAWVKAVKSAEAVQRRMWAAQDRAAA